MNLEEAHARDNCNYTASVLQRGQDSAPSIPFIRVGCPEAILPLASNLLREQREQRSSKVGREVEGLSSSRPVLALRECLEAPEDNINLLYLTDSEASLQVIHKWAGC